MIAEVATSVMNGVVKPILDKFVPDAKDRLEAENMGLRNLHAINIAQIDVNKAEATNPDRFVSGWRPFIGWVCGASFAYAVVGNDILNWGLDVVGMIMDKKAPVLPEPDLTLTFELLMGMLGLAGFRTYEKKHGVAG